VDDPYPALVKTVPIILENQVAGFREIDLDIPEQKKVEQCLVETFEKYRKLVDSLPKDVLRATIRGVHMLWTDLQR
jgi:hypothetical protein